MYPLDYCKKQNNFVCCYINYLQRVSLDFEANFNVLIYMELM